MIGASVFGESPESTGVAVDVILKSEKSKRKKLVAWKYRYRPVTGNTGNQITGIHYRNKSHTTKYTLICRYLPSSGAGLLAVSMTSPMEQRWTTRSEPSLDVKFSGATQ